MTDGFEIFNMCTNLGACHTVQEGGSGTNKSVQLELTWELEGMDRKKLS